MNESLYGSLEACQRLQAAGIKIETEMYWIHDKIKQMNYDQWTLTYADVHSLSTDDPEYPAPSMGEMWREFPTCFMEGDLEIGRTIDGETFAGYYVPADYIDDFGTEVITFHNINPVDALIDLMIWLEQQKGYKG